MRWAPSEAAAKACLDWWRTLTDGERGIFQKARLDPVFWWETTARYGDFMIWEFQHVFAFGGMEVWGWYKRGKAWGPLISVEAIERPDDDVMFLKVLHKDTSPFWIRKNQRDWMKSKLPKKQRKLVNIARKSTKQEWLAACQGGWCTMKIRSYQEEGRPAEITPGEKWRKINHEKGTYEAWSDADEPDAPELIRSRLGMSLDEFWRFAKGKKLIPAERMRDPQLLLFDVA